VRSTEAEKFLLLSNRRIKKRDFLWENEVLRICFHCKVGFLDVIKPEKALILSELSSKDYW
jgi:hypothetical protein